MFHYTVLLSLTSAFQLYKTGTTNSVIKATNIPPKLGIAIGIIISLPLPVDVNTGNNANMVVAVVIKQGLIRFSPASTIDALICFLFSGVFLSNVCVK